MDVCLSDIHNVYLIFRQDFRDGCGQSRPVDSADPDQYEFFLMFHGFFVVSANVRNISVFPCVGHKKPLPDRERLAFSLLHGAVSNHFHAAFHKVGQRFAFQHVVLQQGQVDKLVNHLIACGIAVEHLSLFLLSVRSVSFPRRPARFFSAAGMSSLFFPSCALRSSFWRMVSAAISAST